MCSFSFMTLILILFLPIYFSHTLGVADRAGTPRAHQSGQGVGSQDAGEHPRSASVSCAVSITKALLYLFSMVAKWETASYVTNVALLMKYVISLLGLKMSETGKQNAKKQECRGSNAEGALRLLENWSTLLYPEVNSFKSAFWFYSSWPNRTISQTHFWHFVLQPD